jgi:predicted amidohydrolase
MKVALAQMRVEPGELEANLTRAEQRIREGAEQAADVVLLPECLDLGWTHPSARSKATPIPEGANCQRLVRAAIENRIFVCAGLVERGGDRLFNSAVYIDPKGELLLHHRKIHELDFARELYSTGDRLGVVETPFGTIGLMICADGFAPGQVISRSLALMGAEIILSPCAWAVPADYDNEATPYGQIWLDNYGAVCRDYGITIIGCSNVGPITAGPWDGRKCIGNSMVIGATGKRVLDLAHGCEELHVFDWAQ